MTMGLPPNQGLYDPGHEHDACGVGFLVDLNAMVFGMPMALFPAVVDQRYSSSAIGLLYAAPFLGSFVVSVTSGWTNRIYRHGLAVCWCVAGWGGAIVAFGFVRPLWAAVAMLAIAGGFDMVSGVFRQSIVALATPEGMRGRVEGAGMAVWTTGPALGDLEAGTVARLTSVDVSIVSGGVLCVAGVAVLALSLPTFLRYDRRSLGTASQSTAAPTP